MSAQSSSPQSWDWAPKAGSADVARQAAIHRKEDGLPLAPLDKYLARYDDLHRQRRLREAQAGCLHMLEHAAAQPTSAKLRSILVGAARRAVAIALETKDLDSSVENV